MKIENVLFDLDGTIINSFLGISRCFKHALKGMGRDIPSDEFLLKCVGPPLEYSFKNFFNMSEEEASEGVRRYRERYADIGVLECELIDGAKECLKDLKDSGFKIMLATSKPEPFAVKILKNLDVYGYFHVVCGSDFDVLLKTKTDIIREALKRGGIFEPRSCIMVGDRRYDIEGAKNVGMASLGIRGFAEAGELEEAGADIIADGFFEVASMIKNLK